MGWVCFVFYEEVYFIYFFLDFLKVMLLIWIFVLSIVGKKVKRKLKKLVNVGLMIEILVL